LLAEHIMLPNVNNSESEHDWRSGPDPIPAAQRQSVNTSSVNESWMRVALV